MGSATADEKCNVVITEAGEIDHVPRQSFTQTACLAGLAFTTILGAGFFLAGIAVYCKSQIQIRPTPAVDYFLPLAINVALSVCTECLGFIHATTLKWSLFNEGRLHFNSNLRLFTSSRTSTPNKSYFNALYLVALAFCYTSSGLILVTNNVVYDNDDALSAEARRIVNAPAFLCLGGSLLVMGSICSWATSTTQVPTWSSSPLATLAVAIEHGQQRREGRCMMSVHEKYLDNKLQQPKLRQGSAYSACKQVRVVIWILALTFIFFIVWSIAVFYKAPDSAPKMPGWNIIVEASTPVAVFNLVGLSTVEGCVTSSVSMLCGIIFTAALQAIITVGTHCAELQIALSRDEAIWRKLASAEGASVNERSTFRIAIGSWQSVVLMIFKPVLLWQFSMGVTVDCMAQVHIYVPQMCYFTVMWAFFLAFVLAVTFRKPRGTLPATYGHVQTMVDLVDEWSEKMFWGDKTDGDIDLVRQAGTAAFVLPKVRTDASYE